jgi:cytochrome c oxidase cbb3-type subunit III
MQLIHKPVALAIATLFAATFSLPAQAGRGRGGGFVPGQTRAPEDPAKVERGKALYGINCNGCHGPDLRGGDMGGPNLLRSQLALTDKEGEVIAPIILNGRPAAGMPPIPVTPDDAKNIASYVRSVLETLGRQGMPPGVGKAPPSILVGNASEGQAYFAARCASCHSATGDMKDIATRYSDPKALQNAFVGGGRGGRGGRGGAPGEIGPRTVTVTVKLASGETVEGRLVRVDDFLVTVGMPDGTLRTFQRNGDVPKLDIKDPMKGHRDLLGVYTDKSIHDLTAYLVTLK